ncbi:MAG: family 10 glycosylhydrolase, partial [Muribaculaceae bacterium]|nr:family 10 glycosylhydrolase [Muribaculaceae bacterium]
MKIRTIVAGAALLLATALGNAGEPPKREFRSIWMAAMGIDWPLSRQQGTTASAQASAKAAFIEYIENFKKHNFTGICLQVRPMADALYKSTLEPWSASVSGTRGVDPGWDPLEFAIEECHKRGLE